MREQADSSFTEDRHVLVGIEEMIGLAEMQMHDLIPPCGLNYL